jgi:hypothetical protein
VSVFTHLGEFIGGIKLGILLHVYDSLLECGLSMGPPKLVLVASGLWLAVELEGSVT